MLTNNIHNFIEREYCNLFECNKVRNSYELIGKFTKNSWRRIEKK